MNWIDYVGLSRTLAAQGLEASERSAVSRAYYAAFNLSRRWLEVNVEPIPNRGAHERVWKAFSNAEGADAGTRRKWERVGALGGGLRTLRNQADYADEVPDLTSEASAAIDAAEEIIWLLGELELAD
jgi:uncharacterized protein (UPF0332 family)